MFRSILLFSLILIMSGGAIAGILKVPDQYSTIQAGINAAFPGDTVLVAAGTYYENIDFKGKAITVASHFLIDGDTTHVNSTIIDGSKPGDPNKGSVVSFVSGEDTTSVICGFTITGGNGTLFDSTRIGGGICIISAGTTILHNKIVANHIAHSHQCHGGGIAATCDTTYGRTFIKIIGNTISHNQAISSQHIYGGFGGGVDIVFSNVHLINNIISHNKVGAGEYCYSYGAGVRIKGSTGISSVIDNVISFNTPTNDWSYGGGLLADNNVGLSIKGNLFEGNRSDVGGGMQNSSTGSVISKNTFFRNHANYAGALEAYGTECIISDNKFLENTSEGFGGAICVSFSSPYIFNNIITQNNAGEGGGIYIGEYFCYPQIINNTITDNTSNTDGGGICTEFSAPVVMNTILWGNVASTGPQIHIRGDARGRMAQVVYSDIQGGLSGLGNINVDPQLSDSLTLHDSSPCIGAGIDSLEIDSSWYFCPFTDFKGNPRPDPNGSIPDIGAIESPLRLPTGIRFSTSDKTPEKFSLRQNYPNPFSASGIFDNPSTTIEFALPKSSFVALKVYNLLGKEVATLITEPRAAGIHKVNWDARGLASGVYLYRLEAGSFRQSKKLILMR